MNDSELFLLIKRVLWADSHQELTGIINANPQLLEQKTFDALMEMARQARQNGQTHLNETIMSAMEKIAPFAVSKTESAQSQVSQPISVIEAKVVWAIKARRFLALRNNELLNEAISEASKLVKGSFFGLTANPIDKEIVRFLEAFRQDNIAELNRLTEQLVVQLRQSGRDEEALSVNLLSLDVRAILAEGFFNYPFEQQENLREIGIQSCDHSIIIAQTLNDKACQAIYSGLLASGLSNSRKLAQSEQFYSEGARLYRELAIHEPHIFNQYAATALNNLGAVQSELRKWTNAEKSYTEALQIRQKLALTQPHIFSQDVASTLFNLGIVQSNLRRLAEAEKFYTEAFQIRQTLASREPHIFNQVLATTLNNLGIVQNDLRKWEDAEKSYSQALQIFRQLALQNPNVFNRNVATTLHNLGVVQSNLQKLPEAEKSYFEALPIRRTLASENPYLFNQDLAMTLNNLGAVQSDLLKLSEAEKSLTEALGLYRNLTLEEPYIFNKDLARTLNNLGTLQGDLGRLTDAESSLSESLRIYQALALKEPYAFSEYVAGTLNNLGYYKLQQNRITEAIENYESARNLIEDLRSKANTIDDRNRILQENIKVYNGLLACYIKMKDWKKALEIAELGKSRSLSDLLNLKSEDLQPKAPNADTLAIVKDLGQKYSDAIKELQRLESYEKYLSQQLNSFENDLKRIEDDNDNDDETRQSFLRQISEQKQPLEQEKRSTQEQRFAAQSQLKNILQEINRFDQDFPPKAKVINTESIFEISKQLNRIIVVFRLLEKSTAVIFVFPTGELHIEEIESFGEKEMFYLFRDNRFFPYQRWKFEETGIDEWKQAIEQTLETIYEKLLNLVHRILREKSVCNEVLFVPNQSLALLPLHAACWKDADGKKHYLLEEFTISYAPSVSVFKRCLENEKPHSNKTLFVTNPTADLFFSEQEVSHLQKFQQPNKNFLRNEAAKLSVIEALRDDYSFAHFSCHGFYHQENPFESGLVMSDEVMKLSEIINCNLQNNWLTTLSACETGMVDFQSPTDEHFGLPLGFIFAGSPSVWASLWSVSDMATSELMKTAYESLNFEEYKNNKPEALRQAQLTILKHLPHPFFWAGFQHFGI